MPDESSKPIIISELVRHTVRRAIADALRDIHLPGADAWLEAQQRYGDALEAGLAPVLRRAIPDALWDQPGMETIREIWETATRPKSYIWGTIISGLTAEVLLGPVGGALSVWGEMARQYQLAEHPITIPVPQALIALEYADPAYGEETGRWWRKLGYSPTARYAMTHTLREHLAPEVLVALLTEGALSADDVVQELAWSGYRPEDAARLIWYHTHRADISQIAAMVWRGYADLDLVLEEGRKRGWSDRMTRAVLESLRPLYSPDTAMTALWRGLLTWEQAAWHLAAAGYPPESHTVLQEALRPRLTPPTLIEAYYRGYVSLQGYVAYMQQLGYRPVDAMVALWASTQLLSPTAVQELWHRHRGYGQDWGRLVQQLSYLPPSSQMQIYSTLSQLDPDARAQLLAPATWIDQQHDTLMRELGYTDAQIQMLRSLYPYIPSVPDLVRMAVRDTWSEETVRKYGYDEDFPAAYVYWCLKQGLTPEWALRYWRAHWELPSPTMGYEMYQRGIITREELHDLLRIADYPPYWRDKMIEIAYTPITRVDIRRLYQTGIIKTHEELVRRYMDIGYSPQNAEYLAQFTERMYSPQERDLTKADILGAYSDGILDAAEAREELIKMGYDEEEAEVLLERQALKLIKQLRRQLLAAVREEYTKGIKREDQVYAELISQGFTAAEVSRYLRQWTADRARAAPVPSVDDLVRMAQVGAITVDEMRAEMSARHIDRRYIEMWVRYVQRTSRGGARRA